MMFITAILPVCPPAYPTFVSFSRSVIVSFARPGMGRGA